MHIADAIDYFVSAKRAERRSDNTLENYGRSLHKFADWYEDYCAERGRVPDVERIDIPEVRGYITHLQTQPSLRAVSVASNVRPLKVFLRFMEAEGLTNATPFKRVKVPTFDKELHDLLSDDDLRRLLATCDLQYHKGRRDYAIIAFLFDTGVRVSELTNLKHADVDPKGGYARVFGKGAKERMVFFSAQTSMALVRYTARIPAAHRSKWLFTVLKHGEPGQRLTSNGVSQMLRVRAKQAGVKSRVNPHTFRHTFATNYLRAGGDLNSLMRLLGHADLSIVQTYLSLVNDDLRAKHEQFSPLARVMGRRG